MTGIDYVRSACPVPWWPTPAIDLALWHGWPVVLMRVAELEGGDVIFWTFEEASPNHDRHEDVTDE